jgi:hypothetical protein
MDDTTQITLGGEPETTLINVEEHDKTGVVKVGRSTQFGNPYKLKKDGGNYTREESVQEYKRWFCNRIQTDEDFREEIESLRGEKIGCYCVLTPKTSTERPLDQCHGEVILAHLNGNLSCDDADN